MKLTVKITDEKGNGLSQAQGEDKVSLLYDPEYRQGDQIHVECETPGQYVMIQLDDTISPCLAYLGEGAFTLLVPFGEKRLSYSPRSFAGEKHLLWIRLATEEEIKARKNLALNPWDSHENTCLYPHASANVETRGESVFAARNAIDGMLENTFHGEWPYTSWGINRDPNAQWRLDFGRPVLLDEAVFTLRADFPHDAWWEKASLHFSDGSTLVVQLQKTGGPQSVRFPQKEVEWVTLDTLIKAEDPSPFPALTQLELYGTEVPAK